MRQAGRASTLHTGCFPDEASLRLYEKALSEQWRVAEIDWSALDFAQLARPVRQAMAAVYQDVHLAEAVGVRVQARIVDLAPEGWLRQFSSVQVMDEARHVDFFGKLKMQLQPCAPASAAITDWCDEMLSLHDHDALMLVSLLLETTAQTLFVEGAKHSQELRRRALRMPGGEAVTGLLDYVVHYVGRDEARHLAFGVRYLQTRVAVMSKAKRAELQRRLVPWCTLLHESYAVRHAEYARLGFASDALLERLWRAQQQKLVLLGFELDERAVAAPPQHEVDHAR